MNPSTAQRINLWRHEVALATRGTTTVAQAPAPASERQRRSSRGSFLSKLLGHKSAEAVGRGEELDFTAMYQAVRDEGLAGKGNGARDEREKAGHGDGESSLVMAGLSVSSDPGGGLVAKRQRLERAARLLGKDGGGGDKG